MNIVKTFIKIITAPFGNLLKKRTNDLFSVILLITFTNDCTFITLNFPYHQYQHYWKAIAYFVCRLYHYDCKANSHSNNSSKKCCCTNQSKGTRIFVVGISNSETVFLFIVLSGSAFILPLTFSF